MLTAIADVRRVTIAAIAAVSAAFLTRGYDRSGWTTAAKAVMSRVQARGG